MVVNITKTHEDGIIPQYQTEGSAGFDLHARYYAVIAPGQRVIMETGIAVELPQGVEMQIRPRSGLAAKAGITVVNSPGTIDSDYRGEIKVILLNTDATNSFTINPGDRIAQGVLAHYFRAKFNEVESLSETSRGEGGFGSTGK